MDGTAAILTLLAGIGVFLIACTLLSSNLESVCSNRLRALFARASDKKLVGVGVGTVATAAIQSSGATTVLVIGFVNAGIMSLTLAAAIIYGANIGTTITAQIVALGLMGGDSLSMTAIFGAVTGIGAFMSAYAKKDKVRKIGYIIAGFGMLFVGLEMMKNAMEGFADMPEVRNFLAGIHSKILLVIIGAALTAVVQSSSVMTTVVISMLAVSLIDLEQGIYLTMGSNIGSCVVAIMAGFTSGTNARRTAMIHLLFNVTGVAIFLVAGLLMGLFTGGELTYSSIFADLFPDPWTQLAMFHTVFNVVTVAIMLPLTGHLVNFVIRMVPDRKDGDDADKPHLYFVDEHMLKTPAIAVGGVKKEIVRMAGCAMENFNRACRIISTLDLSEKEEFEKVEKQLNFTNKKLTRFLTKLSNCDLPDYDTAFITTAYHSVTDLERIGDYAENIVEYAGKLVEGGESFSESAVGEIETARATVERLYNKSMEAYLANDRNILKQAHDVEQEVDALTATMADEHIRRLGEGSCSAGAGAEFLALTSDIERIADHFYNVGKSVKSVTPKPSARKNSQ